MLAGDSTPAVQSSAIGQVADWLQQYRAFRQSQRADLVRGARLRVLSV